MFGIPTSPKKKPPIGVSFDGGPPFRWPRVLRVADFGELGVIRFQPKTPTAVKVQAKLQDAIHSEAVRPDDAGKLSGDLNWFSVCAGHAGRFAGPVLAAKQHASVPYGPRSYRPPALEHHALAQPDLGTLMSGRMSAPRWSSIQTLHSKRENSGWAGRS